MDKAARKASSILDVIALVEADMQTITADAFAASPREQELLAFRLLRIGEYVSDLPDNAKARHPEIAWRKAVDLRNLIAHDYDRTDPERIWTVATTELAPLAAACRAIIAEGKT